MFVITAGAELVVGKTGHGIVLLVFGEDVALVVHHGNVVRLQTFHAVGDEEADGIHGGRRQLAVAAHAHEHRGGGLARAVGQQTIFRHHDHHARAFDLVKLADGAGEFALDGAGVIGALHEIGDAEVGLVKNLEAHAFAARDALAGHLHADLINLVGGHHDGAAAAADLVGDLGFVQGGDDLGGLGFVESAIEQGIINAAGPKGDSAQARENHQRGHHDADALVEAELLPDAEELLPQLREVFVHEISSKFHHICIRMIS